LNPRRLFQARLKNKTCPHAGRKTLEEDQENLVVRPRGVAGISK
jgi:hypothetical protein